MNKQWVVNFNDGHLTLMALTIFFTFFVGVLFWVYRKSSTRTYAELEQRPFEEGDAL